MIYFLSLLSVAISFKVFDWLWQWIGIPYEGVVALRGFYFFTVWAVVVLMSFSVRISNNLHYRRFFGTNEKRWCLLAGITFLFFVYCACVGRGQPLLLSIYESAVNGLDEVKQTETYQKNQGVVDSLGKRVWNFLELDNYNKALGFERQPKPKVTAVHRRAFHGLSSWSHWFAFIFIVFNTVLYTFAIRREEIGAWVERKRHEREEQRREEAGEGKDRKEGPSNSWQVADVALDAYEVLSKIGGWVYRKVVR